MRLELFEEISIAMQSLLVLAMLPTEHRHLILVYETEDKLWMEDVVDGRH